MKYTNKIFLLFCSIKGSEMEFPDQLENFITRLGGGGHKNLTHADRGEGGSTKI